MKNSFCLSGLAVALLGLGVVHGQEPSGPPAPLGIPPASPPGIQGSAGVPPPTLGMPAPTTAIPQGNDPIPVFGDPPATPPQALEPYAPGISSWLAYPRGPGCCCRVGGNGPISSEIYLRSGVVAPFGSGILANNLDAGWDIEGGVRTLFFNKEVDAAWTADLSITHMHFDSNHSHSGTITNFPSQVPNPLTGTNVTVNIPTLQVTPNGLDDTFVNLSGGREYYLWGGPATCSGESRWRMGWDVGGRWGTSKLGLNQGGFTTGGEEQHKTGSVSGVFASVHSDIEIPCGCWIIIAGVRAEYSFIFSDILQGQNNANFQTADLMFTIGGRF